MAERGKPWLLTPLDKMDDMNPRTENWITSYRACPNPESIITYLKLNGSYQELLQVFHRTAVPRCMFSQILETFILQIDAEADWKWAGNFLLDLSETHDFDSQTLLVCSQVDNIRIEQVCRKIEDFDKNLAKKCRDSYVDQDWPEDDWY